MIPNPILKVLSTLSAHGVRHLLMGGQACVFYGAAEFSRDCDIVILADEQNFARLTASLEELQAECIAVPPMEWSLLERGHAIHFRCKNPAAKGIRVDVMTKMRGCDGFSKLWEQRTTLQDNEGFAYELLGIEDLVKAKKTQRDKDWPMIRRLVDAHLEQNQGDPTDDRVRFWLRESRTPEVLIQMGAKFPELLRETIERRPLLARASEAHEAALRQELAEEQAAEMEADRQYWQPLIRELEMMRREKRQKG